MWSTSLSTPFAFLVDLATFQCSFIILGGSFPFKTVRVPRSRNLYVRLVCWETLFKDVAFSMSLILGV